LKSRFLKI